MCWAEDATSMSKTQPAFPVAHARTHTHVRLTSCGVCGGPPAAAPCPFRGVHREAHSGTTWSAHGGCRGDDREARRSITEATAQEGVGGVGVCVCVR